MVRLTKKSRSAWQVWLSHGYDLEPTMNEPE